MSHKSFEPCVVGAGPVNIDSLIRVAIHGAEVRLSEDGDWLQRMSASEQRLASAVAEGTPIYGVTTGFGSNCGARVSAESIAALGAGCLDTDIEAVAQAVVAGEIGQGLETSARGH